MKKLSLILTGVFVLTCMSLFAQVFDEDSPFQYVFDEKDKIHQSNYIAVNFVDTATKAVLNTFDLVENNPFNHLEYPEIEVKDPYHKNKSYENIYYSLTNHYFFYIINSILQRKN